MLVHKGVFLAKNMLSNRKGVWYNAARMRILNNIIRDENITHRKS